MTQVSRYNYGSFSGRLGRVAARYAYRAARKHGPGLVRRGLKAAYNAYKNRTPSTRKRSYPPPRRPVKRRLFTRQMNAPDQMVGGGTTHFFKTKKPKMFSRKFWKFYPDVHIHKTQTGNVTAGIGKQGVNLLQSYVDGGDLFDLFAKATDSIKKAINTTTTPFESAASNMYLKGVYGTAMFTNHCKCTVEMDIYNVSCKRDTKNEDPAQSWLQGYSAIYGNGTTDTFVMGNNPNSVPLFRQYWNVDKVTKVTLAPGATHKHTVTLKYGRMVSRTLLDPEGTANFAFKGWTNSTFVVIRPYPVHDGDDPDIVSSGLGRVEWVLYTDFHFKTMVNRTDTYYLEDGLPLIAGPAVDVLTEFKPEDVLGSTNIDV